VATAYDPGMDERDPGADTAMFRAFVERGNHEEAAPPATTNWAMWAAIGAAAIVVVLLLALVLA
jgi:hypothetical protein